MRETKPEDVGLPYHGGSVSNGTPTHALLRETEAGELEAVEYAIENSTAAEEGESEVLETSDGVEGIVEEDLTPLSDTQIDYLNVTANNRREYAALRKLQRDFEAASLQAVEKAENMDEEETIEEEPQEEDEIDEDVYKPDARFAAEEGAQGYRTHPYTVMGEFGPNPSTVYLPKKHFVEPISELLRRTDTAHIKEAAERAFGGPGLPGSVATPGARRNLPQKGISIVAGQGRMSEIEADAYIATVLPGIYASVNSTLVEIRKRLGKDWVRGLLTREGGKGPRVLDVGAGGAGLLAWHEIQQAEWEVLRENKQVKGTPPVGKKMVIVGSDFLRHRISRFLQNTTFLPRLPDYLHSVTGAERRLDSNNKPVARKTFDVIIASHLLLPLDKPHKRKAMLDNLWAMLSPEGGVLIVMEKGHPRGFEAVADVRMRILDEFIIPPTPEPAAPAEIEAPSEHVRKRDPGMIVAPCTNHTKCPMYLTPGLSPGRKDFCHFSQRFIRPPFLQQVLGAAHRNHEDIKFSYLVVRRGTPSQGPVSRVPLHHGKEASDRAFAGYENTDRGFNPMSLPRNILPPLKRHGHVQLDLCTPAGAIERWVVPRSFSRQAYHDARKAQWGDLWALGAKTRTKRDIRLGKAGQDGAVITNPKDRGVRAQEQALGRKKAKVIELNVDPQHGLVGAHEKLTGTKGRIERRTKGGKKMRIKDLLEEAGIEKFQAEEEAEDQEFLRGGR